MRRKDFMPILKDIDGLSTLHKTKNFPGLCSAASNAVTSFSYGEKTYRARLSALFWLVYTQKAWRGIAGSWKEYLEDKNVAYTDAMWGKRIFDTYVISCKMPYLDYEELVLGSNMKCLDRARKVVNSENVYEWRDKLITLRPSDVHIELDEALGLEKKPDKDLVKESVGDLSALTPKARHCVLGVLSGTEMRSLVRKVDKMETADFIAFMENVQEEGLHGNV